MSLPMNSGFYCARKSNDELTKRLDELERAYNERFKMVFEAMRELMRPPRSKRKPLGFLANIPKKRSGHKKAHKDAA
jgi:hypothetical protein